ncbi:hypothetical protein [Klebsiella aerogenes]|uniref:hypothetical protein n=1 Tax=Klebsiella aerogenes TaxID=548 RepID=UPI0036789659
MFLCFAARRAASSPVALRLPGLQTGVATRSPEKVRSTASGESRCHSNVKRKAQSEDLAFCFCLLRPDAPLSSPVALRLPGLQIRTSCGEDRAKSTRSPSFKAI